MRVALVLAVMWVAPLWLSAQQRTQWTVGGFGAQEIAQSRSDFAFNRFTGSILGAEGQLTRNKLWVRVRYAQGRLTSRDGDDPGMPREVVEGEALFGLQPLPWLTVFAGPVARAYTTDETDQRWLFWTVGGSARGSVIPQRLQTFVELWAALSANVTNPATHAAGRGADIGLELRFGATTPLGGRLSYRIFSGQAADMRETVEAITFSLMYGLPQ